MLRSPRQGLRLVPAGASCSKPITGSVASTATCTCRNSPPLSKHASPRMQCRSQDEGQKVACWLPEPPLKSHRTRDNVPWLCRGPDLALADTTGNQRARNPVLNRAAVPGSNIGGWGLTPCTGWQLLQPSAVCRQVFCGRADAAVSPAQGASAGPMRHAIMGAMECMDQMLSQ